MHARHLPSSASPLLWQKFAYLALVAQCLQTKKIDRKKGGLGAYGWVAHKLPKKCNRRNHDHCHRLQNLY
jgi:hypothetical protein